MSLNLGKHLNLGAVIVNSFAMGVNLISGQYTWMLPQVVLIAVCSYMVLHLAEKEAIMKHGGKS